MLGHPLLCQMGYPMSPGAWVFCAQFPTTTTKFPVAAAVVHGIKGVLLLVLRQPPRSLLSMAHNSNLSPEDLLLWQQRAPRAAWWFGVSDHHPFINGGQPVPGLRAPSPPPPYTPAHPPAPTISPALIMPPAHPPYPPIQPSVLRMPPAHLPTLPAPPTQTFYCDNQAVPGMPGAIQPGVVMPFPSVGSVPIYDIRGQANPAPIVATNSLPSRKLNFSYFCHTSIKKIHRFYSFCSLEAA